MTSYMLSASVAMAMRNPLSIIIVTYFQVLVFSIGCCFLFTDFCTCGDCFFLVCSSSEEWKGLTWKERQAIGLKFEEDGEFWYV